MLRSLVAAGLLAVLALPVAAQTTAPGSEPSVTGEPIRRANSAAPAKAKRKKAATSVARARATTTTRFRAASVKPVSLFSSWWDDDDDEDDRPARRVQPRSAQPRPTAPIVASGGPRPEIEPQAPSQVSYTSGQAPGTIVIDTAKRHLFLIQGPSTALSYPISVGREGFAWSGTEKISRVADWPDWYPPAEMRERDPKLPTKMTGGIRNPLGAKALYLGNTLYRIHGTSDARSIGRAASSGCFRMHNRHVVDLARRVGVGTRVVVINAPRMRTASSDSRARARPSP
jgi:lipoprotein-anchoring transpeptidase ErfK/SrfK